MTTVNHFIKYKQKIALFKKYSIFLLLFLRVLILYKLIFMSHTYRFIRKEAVLPPPMNLIPSYVFIAKKVASIFKLNCFMNVKNLEKDNNDVEMKRINSNNSNNKRTKSIGEQSREQNIQKIVQRYKFKEFH